MNLNEAWADADAALKGRADWWRIRSLVEVAFAPMRWEVVATDGNRIVRAEGHDPAAALHALAEQLRVLDSARDGRIVRGQQTTPDGSGVVRSPSCSGD